MSDVLELEAAFVARLGFADCSHVVWSPVSDPDTGEMADSYFTWGGCDCCRDGGAIVFDVEVVAFSRPGRVADGATIAQICGSCLCGLINGDWTGCI